MPSPKQHSRGLSWSMTQPWSRAARSSLLQHGPSLSLKSGRRPTSLVRGTPAQSLAVCVLLHGFNARLCACCAGAIMLPLGSAGRDQSSTQQVLSACLVAMQHVREHSHKWLALAQAPQHLLGWYPTLPNQWLVSGVGSSPFFIQQVACIPCLCCAGHVSGDDVQELAPDALTRLHSALRLLLEAWVEALAQVGAQQGAA
jgi:hypothetical protein